LPVHYERFCFGAGIGFIYDRQRSEFFQQYRAAIHDEYSTSIELALLQEIATECASRSTTEVDGVNIITDARHGWRKNAKDSSIVTIGEKSHQVLHHAHVTKQDDLCSQRHEKLGTERAYKHLEERNVPVNVHNHDRNLSINCLVREKGVTNQNDTWHSIKVLKKAVSNIATGAKYKHGKTWHFQLHDKIESVATHAHWCIQHCGGNMDTLQSSLLNISQHYQNSHEKCYAESRCKQDQNYEPSKIVLTDPKAVELLTETVKTSSLYKNAADYVRGKKHPLCGTFQQCSEHISGQKDLLLNRAIPGSK